MSSGNDRSGRAGIRTVTAFLCSAAAAFSLGCAPRTTALSRAPVVGFTIERADRTSAPGDRRDVIVLGTCSGVKLSPTLLLTAGHCLHASIRDADPKLLVLELEIPIEGGVAAFRRTARFEIAAAGRFDPAKARSPDDDRVLIDLRIAREDWALLRFAEPLLDPPFAELAGDETPSDGDPVFVVTPSARYGRGHGPTGSLSIEGTARDIEYLQVDPAHPDAPAAVIRMHEHHLIGFELGEGSLGGCSGSMVVLRRPGSGSGPEPTDASAWPMVGLFVAGSDAETVRTVGPLDFPTRPVRIATRLTDEIRAAIERERAAEAQAGATGHPPRSDAPR